MKRILKFIAAALILVSAESCLRRPLDISGGALLIELFPDWTVPYEFKGNQPYNYAVMMYSAEDGNLVYEDFCGKTGGRIRAVAGHYSTYVYDLDNTTTMFDGRENIRTLRAYTPDAPESQKMLFAASRLALASKVAEQGLRLTPVLGNPGYEYGRVIREPDMLFGGCNPNVNVPVLALSDKDYVVPVNTDFRLCQSRITITGITKTEYISSVRLYVTNFASSRYVAIGEHDNTPCTETFQATDINEERITGVFNHFGKIPGLTNTAYVIITDTGGGQYLFVNDITDQMEEQGDDADLNIEIDFEIPNPGEGGAGFQPDLDNWEVVWYSIPIGC